MTVRKKKKTGKHGKVLMKNTLTQKTVTNASKTVRVTSFDENVEIKSKTRTQKPTKNTKKVKTLGVPGVQKKTLHVFKSRFFEVM